MHCLRSKIAPVVLGLSLLPASPSLAQGQKAHVDLFSQQGASLEAVVEGVGRSSSFDLDVSKGQASALLSGGGQIQAGRLRIQTPKGRTLYIPQVAVGGSYTSRLDLFPDDEDLSALLTFSNRDGGFVNTAGVLPLMNIAVGIEVWGGLAIVILYLLSGIPKEGT